MPRALVTLLLAAAVVALAGGGSAEGSTFYGKVGPTRTITLKNAAGNVVTSIRKGRHTFVINDTSGVHNFILARGDTNIRKTTIEFTGTVTWTVRIRRGKIYRYYCSVHSEAMSRTFHVP
jgi:hypothetical protein